MTKTFKDNTGLSWDIPLTLQSFREVYDQLGIDLYAIYHGTPPLIERLSISVPLLVDLLWVFTRPQREQRGVLTEEQFAKVLFGSGDEAPLRSARRALFEGLPDFFRSFGDEDLAIVTEKKLQITEGVLASAAEAMKHLDVATISKALAGMPGASLDELSSTLEA